MRVPVASLFDPAIIAAGSAQQQPFAQLSQTLPNFMHQMRQPFWTDPSFSIYKAPPAAAGMYLNPWFWQMDPAMLGAGIFPGPTWMPGPSPLMPGAAMPTLQTLQGLQSLQNLQHLQGFQNLQLPEVHAAGINSGCGISGISGISGCGTGTQGGQGGGSPTAQGKRRAGRTTRGGKRIEGAMAGAALASLMASEPVALGINTLAEIRRDGAKSQISLKEAMPFVAELAKDSEGSKYLQAKLDSANAADRDAVFEALLPEAAAHASDANGCTVIQKLLEIGTLDQRKALAQRFQGEVLKLSNKMYGCRVIQKAFQVCSPEVQLGLAAELKKGVIDCIKSMHGNHVVQKCIEQMPPDSVAFVVEAIEERAESMASHIYGCRIIQRLLEHCAPHRLETMLQHILKGAFRLSQDPFGNYVVRHILEHGRKEHKRQIIEMVSNHILELGRDKCASNVVEKCFEAATVGEHAAFLLNERQALFRSMMQESENGMTPLQQLVDDRFGKYVVSCMADHSRNEEEKKQMREQIETVAPKKRGTSNGVNVLSALSKELSQTQATIQAGLVR